MLQVVEQRSRVRLSHRPTLVRWFAADIGLDQIQFGDAAQRLCRQRRWSRHVQVVEFAARVRPTCRFVNAAIFVQGVEAGEMLCITFRRLCCGQIYVAVVGKHQDLLTTG